MVEKSAKDYLTTGSEATRDSIRLAFAAAGIELDAPSAVGQYAMYLELLQRWNAKVSLTAIRDPQQIIQRHFVESAFAAQLVPAATETLLDFGSGAGFPGLPIAICRPEILVTLAESQTRKASFLREAVRVANTNCIVLQTRVEALPPTSRFDVVTMRAVDNMEAAIPHAAVRAGKRLMLLTTTASLEHFQSLAPEFLWDAPVPSPRTRDIVVAIGHRKPK